jgi:hypothetical protein
MQGLFGFDPNTLSDEQLMDRVTELNRRISWSAKFTSGASVGPLQDQKMQCEQVQRERAFLGRMGNRISSPSVVVESDPDLAAAQRAEREAAIAALTPTKPHRPKPFQPQARIKPTAHPITPIEGK